MVASQWLDINNRMKPLDVTKVLMGIRSKRENVQRFEQDRSVWGRRKEYDYMDIFKVCEAYVPQFYMDNLPGVPMKAVLRWRSPMQNYCMFRRVTLSQSMENYTTLVPKLLLPLDTQDYFKISRLLTFISKSN